MTTSTQNNKESDRFKDLIGPMDPRLDREIRERLITARVGLLLRASFFGHQTKVGKCRRMVCHCRHRR